MRVVYVPAKGVYFSFDMGELAHAISFLEVAIDFYARNGVDTSEMETIMELLLKQTSTLH